MARRKRGVLRSPRFFLAHELRRTPSRQSSLGPGPGGLASRGRALSARYYAVLMYRTGLPVFLYIRKPTGPRLYTILHPTFREHLFYALG